jgi:hypothetical protein
LVYLLECTGVFEIVYRRTLSKRDSEASINTTDMRSVVLTTVQFILRTSRS